MKDINNITETALIFEGGGMRGSYTAGFVNTLLEHNIHFDYVAGISAGSSHSVNYLSRDTSRTKKSFVDLVKDPNFGGWGSFMRREGFFRAEYIYEQTPYPEGALPFDMQTFLSSSAQLRIGAYDRDNGETVYFSEQDISSLSDLMKIVRASSSLPVFMPPTEYKGRCYLDGGLGLGGGIALDVAKRDGRKKFFVVLSREKGYRKPSVKFSKFFRAYYHKYSRVVESILNRHIRYNQALEELLDLERDGKAFLVYPDVMPVSNREIDHQKLSESYRLGYAQGQRDIPSWKAFLGIE